MANWDREESTLKYRGTEQKLNLRVNSECCIILTTLLGWWLSKNAYKKKKKSNSRLLLSSKTNARIRNDVSAFFAVTTLFRGVETGIPTSAISNASYFAGLYEKWWRIRDAVARTRSERLRHGLSVTIKRAGCRLVINGGAFLKLIGDARPDPHAGRRGTSHVGRSRDTSLCFRESPRKTVAGPKPEIDIKIGAQRTNE